MIKNYSVREMTREDIPRFVSYWLESEESHLLSMGVDLKKLPSKGDLERSLEEQIWTVYKEKNSYSIIWLIDNEPVGYCNVDQIQFGKSAKMHLHFWEEKLRKQGLGTQLVQLSLPYFWSNLLLENIISEPYFQNKAPHAVLEKCDFELMQEYITVPGSLNFEQKVKSWKLEKPES